MHLPERDRTEIKAAYISPNTHTHTRVTTRENQRNERKRMGTDDRLGNHSRTRNFLESQNHSEKTLPRQDNETADGAWQVATTSLSLAARSPEAILTKYLAGSAYWSTGGGASFLLFLTGSGAQNHNNGVPGVIRGSLGSALIRSYGSFFSLSLGANYHTRLR